MNKPADLLKLLPSEWMAAVSASLHVTPMISDFEASISYRFVMGYSDDAGSLILERTISRCANSVAGATHLAIEAARAAYANDLILSQRINQ